MVNQASSRGYFSVENQAPELVREYSDLIPVSNDHEAPEAVHQYHYQYLDTQSRAPSYSPGDGFASKEKSGVVSEEGANALSVAERPKAKRRKRIVWIVIGIVLLLLAIALGVGLGIGLSQSSDDGNSPDAQEAGNSNNNTNNEPTSTTTKPPTSTTTSYITTGTTGLAQYSCTDSRPITTDSNTTYIQDCGYQYQTGHPSFYNQNITMTNLDHTIVYTFESCLDYCDSWNAANNHPACRAVTYYANLTAPVDMWGGNCFLKNDRGQGYRTDPVDYGHTVSAWMGCLNVTCFGSD